MKYQITLKNIFRDSFLNLTGNVVPTIVAFFAIPVVLAHYGVEKFGILSLVWMFFGYFYYFDFGFGRATVKLLSDALSRKDTEAIPKIIWTSLILTFLIGIIGMIIAICIIPVIIRHVFQIPGYLQEEAMGIFIWVSASFPVVVLTALQRGVFEAHQRFDVVNAVKAPSSGLLFLIPLLGALFSWPLQTVAILMVVNKILTALCYHWFSVKIVGIRLFSFNISKLVMKSLIGFGGWVTLTNFISSIIQYAERVILTILQPLSALAYYSAPFEGISRIAIIPSSIAQTLFPAFSEENIQKPDYITKYLIVEPIMTIGLFLIPLITGVILFAPEILTVWLGTEFRDKSTWVLMILSIAFLANAFSYILLAGIQGIGRPDLKAKLDLVLGVLFIAAGFWCVKSFSITGAAIVRMLISSLDAGIMFYLYKRTLRVSSGTILPRRLLVLGLMCSVYIIFGVASVVFHGSLLMRSILYILEVSVLVVVGWTYLLPREVIHALSRKISARG